MGENPNVSIRLKDNKPFYFEDERIQVTINLQLKKILKNPFLFIRFKGRASSYRNKLTQHFKNIFEYVKEIPIKHYNKKHYINKEVEFDYIVEVPNNVKIPSYKEVSLKRKVTKIACRIYYLIR